MSSDEINLFKRGRSPLDTEANPLWIGGTFEIDGDQLTARMAPDFAGGHVWEAIFRILDDRIVALDGNLAFLFKPEPIN